jgi:hypothetical protein
VPDERRLKDCLHVIYDRSRRLALAGGDSARTYPTFLGRWWRQQRNCATSTGAAIQEQMLDSVLLLAHRVSGLGVDSELMRASPDFDDHTPRFVALSAEAIDFVNAFRAGA